METAKNMLNFQIKTRVQLETGLKSHPCYMIKKKNCFYSLGFNSCLKTVWQAIFKEGGLVWQGVFKTTKCLDCSLGAIGCCTYIFSKNKKQKKA